MIIQIAYCILFTILVLMICYILYKVGVYVDNKSKYESIHIDLEKLNIVQVLQPWIHSNIEKATEFVLQKYMVDASRERISKTLTTEQYTKLIYDIRSQFYGSIPTSVNTDYLFKYIDQKQIDILIVSAFRIYNDNYFTVKPE